MSDSQVPRYDPQVLLNSQPVIVSVIDPATHEIQFQNETARRKFGETTGSACYAKIAGEMSPCMFCRMPEAMASDSVVSNEVALPGDKHLLVHWSKAPTTDGRTHIIETITDITESKRTEQALRQSQKMEAVGRLAGGIAHDFNNLMMVVIGHAHRLLQQFSAHPSKRELELISHAGMRAAALTKKLLSFSRRQVFEPKELSIHAAVRDMEDILRRLIGEQIQTIIVLHPQTGHAIVDSVQLEQIIMNLVLNARDAMPDGGLLNIETDNIDLDEQFAKRHPGSTAGPYVKIMVQDTGCGMDADTLSHIFEPFFTTKGPDKGTGLGLATVYGIVKQSQGYIEVASEPERGSRFTVYLPRVEPALSEVVGTQRDTAAHVTQETILVVEDEESIRRLMANILQDHGYHVLMASDGMEALQNLQGLKGPCHLVITDVIMPRMKSSAFVEGLRAMRPETNVLYMSGYAGDTLQANGVTDETPFLQKPFPPSTLIEKIHDLLQTPSR
ncbi:Hybrid sensor histidine kinase [Nitrospira sp. KM1]|uniref:ATP-binding protein n=1 Tax=Nitrospira sp. KM1 TaxID=1936990 RepID=UPI0013A796F3|nr:ATP-binding protein [Nitrospira sp. KM1]BCA54878.1 Hybrid sensor histidine kinase [Nitrospira sp. KM1]